MFPLLPALLLQRQNLDLADRHPAPRVMLLKSEMPGWESLLKVDVLVELLAVDGHLDLGHFAVTPFAFANFHLVIEPGVGFDQLLVDVAKAIERAGAEWVSVRAVDLGFVAIEKTWLAGGAEIHSRVATVADFDFRAVFEILERTGSTDEHRGVARSANRGVDDFPFTRLAADSFPALQRLAIEQGLPLLGVELQGTAKRQNQ